MAFARNAGFTSAIATDPAATAAGLLTPTRYNLPFVVADAVSGGIPFFSSTTAEGTSALLAAGGVMIGGGAGVAPFTDAGLTYNSTTDTLTTGKASIGVGTASLPSLYLSTDTTTGWYRDSADSWTWTYVTFPAWRIRNTGMSLYTTWGIQWGAGDVVNTQDTGIFRLAAGVVSIGTGSFGSFAGRAKLTSTIHGAVAVGTLNAAPTVGEIQSVNNALAPAVGVAVAAGGAANALVWWNGAQWTVIGI